MPHRLIPFPPYLVTEFVTRIVYTYGQSIKLFRSLRAKHVAAAVQTGSLTGACAVDRNATQTPSPCQITKPYIQPV